MHLLTIYGRLPRRGWNWRFRIWWRTRDLFLSVSMWRSVPNYKGLWQATRNSMAFCRFLLHDNRFILPLSRILFYVITFLGAVRGWRRSCCMSQLFTHNKSHLRYGRCLSIRTRVWYFIVERVSVVPCKRYKRFQRQTYFQIHPTTTPVWYVWRHIFYKLISLRTL